MIFAIIFVPIVLLVAVTIIVCCVLCTQSDNERALKASESEERKLKLTHQAEEDRRRDAETAADAAVERSIRLKKEGIVVTEISASVVKPQRITSGNDAYGYPDRSDRYR